MRRRAGGTLVERVDPNALVRACFGQARWGQPAPPAGIGAQSCRAHALVDGVPPVRVGAAPWAELKTLPNPAPFPPKPACAPSAARRSRGRMSELHAPLSAISTPPTGPPGGFCRLGNARPIPVHPRRAPRRAPGRRVLRCQSHGRGRRAWAGGGRVSEHLVTNDVAGCFPVACSTRRCAIRTAAWWTTCSSIARPGRLFSLLQRGQHRQDLAWFREQAEGLRLTLTDRSADYALLALQGPLAAAIVQPLTGARLGPVNLSL